VAGDQVECRVDAKGAVSSHKGVNLPHTHLSTPAFTDKDRRDLEMGLAHGVDFVAMSFVRNPQDLAPVLEMMNLSSRRPLLIAKIEKPEAVSGYSDILEIVDGIMVARGDLGVEMPLEQVPMIQKRLIDQARQAGKVVITATQMLRSMIDSLRPTRAEAADVANAILDGTDAVMLSEESAIGAHPVEAVRVLGRIARSTEPFMSDEPFLKESVSKLLPATEAGLSRAACWLARDLKPAAIVASTTSGGTARLIARYRSPFPVLGMTPDPATCRQLNLSWGVTPALIPTYASIDEMVEQARAWLLENQAAVPGDRVIITAGAPVGVPGTTNLVRVLDIT
jgi:pyruvate kinase